MGDERRAEERDEVRWRGGGEGCKLAELEVSARVVVSEIGDSIGFEVLADGERLTRRHGRLTGHGTSVVCFVLLIGLRVVFGKAHEGPRK